MKNINLVFSDDEQQLILRAKAHHNLTWKKLFLLGIKKLEGDNNGL